MNALSTMAAKMKEKKVKKLPRGSKLSRSNSTSDALSDAKQEKAMETEGDGNPEETEQEGTDLLQYTRVGDIWSSKIV